MHSNISISVWNINGLKHKTLGNKLDNSDFTENIKDHDFNFITETWSNETNCIPGFKAISTKVANPKSKSNCRKSGGISLLYKTKYEHLISTVKLTKNFLWCRIDKFLFNAEKDLLICGIYIPPEKSPYFDEEIFNELENDIIYFSSKGNILLLGDFNARTGKLDDFISKEGNSFINDVSENSFTPTKRENFDSMLNKHGKQLIEICRNCNLRILNGRTLGDSLGKPTFHGRQGTSTVDYIISDQDLIQNVENFIVNAPTYLSDHSQILTWIKKQSNNPNAFSNRNEMVADNTSYELPSQYIWESNAAHLFKENLYSLHTQTELNRLINSDPPPSKEGVNDFTTKFESIIKEAAKKSFRIKKPKYRHKISNISNKKWFDKECRLKRHMVRKLANKKHRDPQNTVIREEYHNTLKMYKDTLRRKKEEFHEMKLNDLEAASESDPNSFWSTLKNLGDDIHEQSSHSSNVTAPNWVSHFESLHAKHNLSPKQNNILEDLNSLETDINKHKSLDDIITEQEIINASKKLKNKKAAYSDKIKNEMIKSSVGALLIGYKKLFNLILQSGTFPNQWCEGLITPIFKSGEKSDTNNYRGICVTSCLSKFFCSILNQRLSIFSEKNNLIHPSQIGFKPKNRTADHIFTLKTLIDKHVGKNTNGKIYTCFVDFKKAFDSVWHDGLFLKLLQNGIDGQFYKLIKSLYCNSRCAVKLGNTRTEFFSYSKGVRQGCILSPQLFNLYINELASLLDNTNPDPFMLPNGTKLSCLLYADDLIILSKSKLGMQKCLNELHHWCEKWLMQVNIKKTQAMIIQSGNTKMNKPNFLLGNKTISIVREYCYLGIKLNSIGKFTLALKQLSEKALHALYSIRRHLNIHKLKPALAMKIFNSMISPILLYNSEIWGAYLKNDFSNWDKLPIEKVHLRFCKMYLGVGKKASNSASRGELGKFPLLINIFKRLLKYTIHLNSLPDTTIAKQMFSISKNLYLQNKTSFYGNAMNILKSYKCLNITTDLESISIESITQITDNIKNNYIKLWTNQIENSNKLIFYSTVKKKYQLENYLNVIKNVNIRKQFTRFRISNHNLMIECGRYKNITQEERLCEICSTGEIESEQHFLFSCKAYDHLRNKLELDLNQTISVDLMMSTNVEIILQISKFIHSCFVMRDKCFEAGNVRTA